MVDVELLRRDSSVLIVASEAATKGPCVLLVVLASSPSMPFIGGK